MIVDSHVHLMSPNFTAKPFWDSWVRLASALSGRPAEEVGERLPDFYDDTGDLLIKDMDEARVDQAWILVLDYGLSKVGECKYSITELNKEYAEIAQRSNNRLVAFFSIDPRREHAVRLLETGIRECGMRGLKLLPSAGFYPNDENCYKLYTKAVELGIPVIVHTGPEIIPGYSKYCYPIYLDEVANDFPELPLVLAHAGFCWWQEALSIASTKPNVYLDLSGWQPKLLRRPIEEFYIPLRTILDTIGPSRVLFGSDWPAYRLLKGGEVTWVKAFKEPPEALKEVGIIFTEGEMNAILGGNASRIVPRISTN